jgi:hypothetical protein
MRIKMKVKHRELEADSIYDVPEERARALVEHNLAKEVEDPKQTPSQVETTAAEPKAEKAVAPRETAKPRRRTRKTTRKR